MRLLTPIQFLVIWSNAYWPFSWLNKLPYFFAIRIFRRLCVRMPEIHSAYLRHSVAEGRWEPGLSDIDLTILLVPGMTREDEFDFLVKFRGSYQKREKYLPILGELEALPLNYMKSWRLFSMRGRGVRNWILLCGEDFRKNVELRQSDSTSLDSLSYSFYVYIDSFTNRLLKPVWGPLLESEFLRRLLIKIEHYTQITPPQARKPGSVRSPELVHLQIVQAIEKASPSQNTPQSTHSFEGNPAVDPAQTLGILESEAVSRSLICLLEDTERYFAILDLDAQPEYLLRSIGSLQDRLGRKSHKLIILGPRGFETYLRLDQPYLYSKLSHSRIVHMGADPLPFMLPPPTEAYVRRTLSQFSMAVATFPQGHELMSLCEQGGIENPVYLSILMRILYIQLFLDTGALPKSFGHLNKECFDRYEHEIEKFQRLADQNPPDIALQLFRILRDRLDTVNQSLSKTPGDLFGC